MGGVRKCLIVLAKMKSLTVWEMTVERDWRIGNSMLAEFVRYSK